MRSAGPLAAGGVSWAGTHVLHERVFNPNGNCPRAVFHRPASPREPRVEVSTFYHRNVPPCVRSMLMRQRLTAFFLRIVALRPESTVTQSYNDSAPRCHADDE
ncbi:hypothetical protein L210DRAFT_3592932 [Boletus edulis BED1]|uniref:Uncharacterized protein n=1 Tax=Boletus edulis BED1 TaxID=1328754 RepID=A0AAD4G534_BOLED|nr:hypothetical protein L210DRAFT_3592932 [Boletus edulis BED1]